MKRLLAGGYATMLVLSVAVPAMASQPAPPQYESSEPSDGATVHEPPDRVEATFDQPLDESSQLEVRDECDRRIESENTEVEGNSMSVALTEKPSGDYHVEYVAVGLGSVTGTSTGHFTFTAHGGEACDGEKKKHKHHNNKGNKGKNGHKGHEKNKKEHEHQRGGHGEEHDDDEHAATGHTGGTDHDTHSSSGSGSTHSQHQGSGNGKHGEHHAASGNGGNAVATGDVPGITSNDTSQKLLSRADSGTLMLSLALCLVLGVLGGAVLRASNAR